jgi:hypothetical protein
MHACIVDLYTRTSRGVRQALSQGLHILLSPQRDAAVPQVVDYGPEQERFLGLELRRMW